MTHDDQDYISGPDRIMERPGSRLPAYILAAVICAVAALGLWYLLAPDSMARVYGRWQKQPLAVSHLTLTVDRQSVDLPPNSTIEIHPGQRFSISGLATSRWRNYDLLLSSPDFDISAVTGGASAALRDIMPEEAFDGARKLRIIVLDKGQEAASFEILTRFTAFDYAARGDAAEDPSVKADFYRRALELDPTAGPLRDKLINALTKAGRLDEAAETFEAEIARDGAGAEALTRLLALYQSQNNLPRQVETLGRLAALAGEKTDEGRQYRRRQAEIYRQGNMKAEAAAIYESLAAEAPKADAAGDLAQLVFIYRDLGDSPKEIDALKKLAAAAPPDQAAGIWAEITNLYNRTGDAGGRLAAWENLTELLPEGEAKVNGFKNIGYLLVQAEEYAKAAQAYEKALEMAPDDVNLLLNLANLAYRQNDGKSYREHLAKVVELTPDDHKRRLELAEALAAAKQNGPAKTQYQELLKRSAADKELSQAYAAAYIAFLESAGDKAGLIQQYDKMLETRPDDKIVLYNLGALHFERKQWDKAIEAFSRNIALDAEDMDARQYLLLCYQRKGSRKNIIEQAMELYRRDPSQSVYRTLMLNTQENAKDWEGFAAVAKAVTELEPDSAFGWVELARAQEKLKKNKDAAESLWQAAERTKNKAAAAWLKAAEAAAGQKQTDRARQAYQKVIELEPKNAKAVKALKEM
ncbi:tetratricopeptide repeat protein [Deltaproteobacteria bacterium OttesenSCG-928-K17]|nr:tetratricopeptide repeat protein [Deltaproteobacteria bacterium OttesenSCG-928-K17]